MKFGNSPGCPIGPAWAQGVILLCGFLLGCASTMYVNFLCRDIRAAIAAIRNWRTK